MFGIASGATFEGRVEAERAGEEFLEDEAEADLFEEEAVESLSGTKCELELLLLLVLVLLLLLLLLPGKKVWTGGKLFCWE